MTLYSYIFLPPFSDFNLALYFSCTGRNYTTYKTIWKGISPKSKGETLSWLKPNRKKSQAFRSKSNSLKPRKAVVATAERAGTQGQNKTPLQAHGAF